MEITKSIKKAIANDKRQLKPNFSRLQKFYLQKIEKGVAIKKEYNIPPLDKQERSYYEACLSK